MSPLAPAQRFGENTILGDGSIIEANVTLRETILWEGARVSAGTHLERCVVGKNAQVQSNVAIFDANICTPAWRMTAKRLECAMKTNGSKLPGVPGLLCLVVAHRRIPLSSALRRA